MMYPLVALKRVCCWTIAWLAVALTRICDSVHVAELISLLTFRFGNQVRYRFYKSTLESCGEDVTINFGTIISSRLTRLGSHIWLGTYNIIGQADIRDFTLTAQGSHIVSGARGHDFDNTDVPIMQQSYKPTRCTLRPDAWLGSGTIVMANVGQGCVIGAGSVVEKDILDWSVAAGNPAKVIRSRLRMEREISASIEKETDAPNSPFRPDRL